VGWFKASPLTTRSGLGGVTVSLNRPPSAGAPALRVRLGRRAMRDTGWEDGRIVELMFGDEEHAGKVMIRPADEDGSRLRAQRRKNKSSIDTTFGFLPREPIPGVGGAEWTLLRDRRPTVEADWEVAENALVITLPREWWQVATPASVAGRRAAAEPGKPAATPTPRGPAADDRIERVISMLERGLSTEEVRQHERCSPQFVHDCREVLAKRKAGQARPERSAGLQGDLARIREKALAVNGSAT
jgi:hypothetical protein